MVVWYHDILMMLRFMHFIQTHLEEGSFRTVYADTDSDGSKYTILNVF